MLDKIMVQIPYSIEGPMNDIIGTMFSIIGGILIGIAIIWYLINKFGGNENE